MSTKQNQHIEDYLDAYRKMDDVDFAVMITGSWGCGKTHFIEDYLKRKCTPKSEKKYIYISLNGISNAADIDMALFQAAHPILGSKVAVMAGKIVKASVRTGFKINLDVDGNGKNDATGNVGIPLDDFKLKTKGKFLVFDDLERCLLKPEEVLGYINSFVENKEAKVIVVGDETQIGTPKGDQKKVGSASVEQKAKKKKEPSEKYWVIKEKVVGKTFKLTENIEEVLPALITKKAYPLTHVLILNNRTAVISVFKRVNDELQDRHNYRALKHAFRDFEYFYSHLDEKHQEHRGFINDLLGIFIAFAYELQLKTITTDDIQTLNIPTHLFSRKEVKDDTPLDLFVGRHGISRLNQILPVDIWCTILKNEPLDKEALFEIISSTEYFRKEAELPAWKKLQGWWLLQDDVCAEAIKSVRKELEEYTYKTPLMILHVFGVMMELAASNMIEESKDDILQTGINYLGALLKEGSLELPDRKFDYDLMDGFMANRFAGHQNAEFKELHEKVASSLRLARVEDQKSKVPEILETLKRDPDEFRQNIGFEGEWFNEPVLSLISPNEFYSALRQTSNHGVLFVEDGLKRRYEFINTFPGLVVELDFLKKLRELVDEDLGKREGLKTPSSNAFERLRAMLTRLIKLIEQNEINTAASDDADEIAE